MSAYENTRNLKTGSVQIAIAKTVFSQYQAFIEFD